MSRALWQLKVNHECQYLTEDALFCVDIMCELNGKQVSFSACPAHPVHPVSTWQLLLRTHALSWCALHCVYNMSQNAIGRGPTSSRW